MAGDLFDFGFDDPAPAELKPKAAPPPAPAAPAAPCTRRAFAGGYRCRVGGGDACYSDNNGQSWFCRVHVPRGFLPADREARP
jgi:hypothetical protein